MREVPLLTAAALIIGDEILSGRTQDVNLAIIARFLAPLGIDVAEARVVSDRESEIVAAVNALRKRYTYVFTTGGIGPTHDDITADAIGAAFELPVEHNEAAIAILSARYKPGEFNEKRRRMARMPRGAQLIRNSISAAPGFQIENVFVMAGVPKVMAVMLDDVKARLQQGVPVTSRSLRTLLPEGRIAAPLEAIQQAHPELRIGSYPFYDPEGTAGGAGTTLVVRGRDNNEIAAAVTEIIEMAAVFGAAVVPVD
jgi:molybdenum cofactor synthesis domain-containing protein